MSQNDTLHLAQEFLARMGSGAEPAEIAKLFSENMEWEIAGDTGVLPWIGQKSGRAAITDFVRDWRAMIERVSFEVHDILAGDDRAVILGSLASKLKRTGKIAKTDFAIVLSVANGEIVRFQNRVVPGPSRPTRAGERIARGAVFREGQVTVDFAVVWRWSLPGAMLLLGALSRFPGVASCMPSALSNQLAALSGMRPTPSRVVVASPAAAS